MPATHRRLDFATLDDAIAETRHLQQRGYDRHGQWTLGQICHHLTIIMRGSLDGFPPELKAPPLLRWFATRTKRLWLDRPMPRGIKLRGPLAALRPPEPGRIDEDAAIDDAVACFERLKAEPQRHPSPVAGELTREQWNTLHKRHAAHHLGFLSPKS